MKALFTVGHGTAAQEDFTALLASAGVTSLVDVRIGPGSRKHPQFGKDLMSMWLPDAGISYRWERRLGGFRKLPPDSPDTALRNDSFRAYAAYMRSPDFGAAVGELLAAAQDQQTAIMCSETVWWRCHRRLIADYCLLLAGRPVEHLMPPAKLTPHVPTRGVRVGTGSLVYDVSGTEYPGIVVEGIANP
ncbi:DUF488 family protein [Pseudarthrobacter sp. 1G09]|uniref:DUF488 domain-containing protein n=1 Tax=Pseudarthrobacter sp. 1G09 TaxID=3416178 RepID=UPI003CF22F54